MPQSLYKVTIFILYVAKIYHEKVKKALVVRLKAEELMGILNL